MRRLLSHFHQPGTGYVAIDESSHGEERINELIAVYLRAIELDTPLDLENFLEENIEYSQELRSFIHNHEKLRKIAGTAKNPTGAEHHSQIVPDPNAETVFREYHSPDDPSPQLKLDLLQNHVQRVATPGVLIAEKYLLISKIGEGGMGEVWVAKQLAPVKRKVAIKLIKWGIDPPRDVALRFEQERQALAMMDHPNIAKVFDGGISRGGVPFFVMELVNGLPLSKYCDETRLSIRERLELIVPICQAVQHAHQKGIVHRDLKPSNLLVTLIDGRAVPKIIDFGISKALGGKLTDLSLSTQFGAIVGTMEYMAPEQAGFSGTDVDTRADIYSLGVILYEILTGLKPFDSQRMRQAAMAELLRIIREEEPSKPSERISTAEGLPSLAASRRIEPARFPNLLRGELDWVVMKCLEKQRDRRYETANALARDIQRYLSDEAVEARPPSALYQVRKLIRRHKGIVVTSALVFLSMFFGVIGTSLGLLEARRQKDLAIDAKNEATALAASEAQARQDEHTASTEVERQRKLVNDRAEKLRIALADSFFRQGLYEYDAGQTNTAIGDLTRALAITTPETPLYSSYRRVLVDRCLNGGRQLLHPLWHDGPVYAAAFNRDGTRIVTASGDKTVRIWDTTTGTPVGKSMLHDKEVSSACFSPVGTRVVTRSGNIARLWDALGGSPVGTKMEHEHFITSVAFSPDGALVLTSSLDKTARLWDAESGLPFALVMQHDAPVYSAAFSPDGKHVATGTGVHTVTGVLGLWDAQTGKPVGDGFQDFKNIVRSVTFSDDGTRLLTGGQDWTARVWDAETGVFLGPKLRNNVPIKYAIFSPDGTQILTCDSEIGGYQSFNSRLWDASTGAPIGAVMEHAGYVRSMAFSPDGTLVATAAKAKQGYAARLWDAATGAPVGEPMMHQSEIFSVSFSPDGRRMLTGSNDNTARVWNINTEHLVAEEMKYPDEDRDVVVAYSPDGTRFVTGGGVAESTYRTGVAHLYDGRTGSPIVKEMKHIYWVFCAAFSPDSTRIVTGSGEWKKGGQAQLWDGHSGVQIGKTMNHRLPVTVVAFSPDGNRVITSSSDGTARIWDAQTGVEIGDGIKHEGQTQIAFNPDGNRVVTASNDCTVRFWDAFTGRPLGDALKHESEVITVAFSPDGKSIATGSSNGTAQLWDAETCESRGNPMKHDGQINRLVFSPDGTRLVTGSDDFTARLWAARTGAPLGEVMQHENQVRSVAFSPDGTFIITAAGSNNSTRGMVRLWEAHTGASIGKVMDHLNASNIAFSPDGIYVISGGSASAKLWNVTSPKFEPNSSPLSHEILQLWTGCNAEEDGTLHRLTSNELDSIHRQVGNNDPLRRFAMDQWQADNVMYHARAASVAEAAGRWADAVSHLEKIVATAIGTSAIQARRAFALAKLAEARNEPDQALKGFDEAIRLDPSNATFYLHRGDLRLRYQNDRDAAQNDYSLAIRYLSISAVRLNEKAWLWATSPREQGRNGMLAVIAAKKVCEMTEWNSSAYMDTLAAAYAENNDFENAIKWQTRAIEICTDKFRNELINHLELYKSNKPCRE